MPVKSRLSGEIVKMEKTQRRFCPAFKRTDPEWTYPMPPIRLASLLARLSGSHGFTIIDCTLNFILIQSLFSRGTPMR